MRDYRKGYVYSLEACRKQFACYDVAIERMPNLVFVLGGVVGI